VSPAEAGWTRNIGAKAVLENPWEQKSQTGRKEVAKEKKNNFKVLKIFGKK
jgi:hypothetical protein